MAAQIRTYFAFVYESGARLDTIGNLGTPFGTISTKGRGVLPRTTHVLAPGEKKLVWDYTQLRDFELLVAHIRGEGYLHLALEADTPVSGDDLSPSGSNVRLRHFDLSCYTPFVLNTDQCLINTTAADEHAYSNGVPTMFGDADTVPGKWYKLWAYNPGTKDVELVVSVFN